MLRPAALAMLLLVAGFALAHAVAAPAADETPETEAAEAARAEDAKPDAQADDDPQTICTLIEAAAKTHRLPVEFLTRLIWKESRFRPDAVSPKGAQGIAQFMPGTAALRKLADPFDPIEAIPASAHYLRDLADEFGNLGLAAAAYNSGEKRVEGWMAGTRGLPWETRDFVLSITGRTADEWTGDDAADAETAEEAACLEVAALLAKPGAGSAVVRAIEKAGWAPWGAQVAGNFSQNRAIATYERLQRRHGEILGDQAPMVIRTVNRSIGSAPIFQIRVPADTRDAANAICKKLNAAGGACVVLKTGR